MYKHQFNLFDLWSETALNKDGGVEALSHVEDQQVGAIIQRPLATHISLSIKFGSHSRREENTSTNQGSRFCSQGCKEISKVQKYAFLCQSI